MQEVMPLHLSCRFSAGLLSIAAMCLSACGCTINVANKDASPAKDSAKILVDGSSTVYPITQAMAEAFKKIDPQVQIPVAGSGTGSGFKKLIAGEIDIAGASRPVTEKESKDLADKGIEILELQVAIDGISIVVNKDNDWCTALTVKQLGELWKTDSKVETWKQLDPSWPDSKIKLFGAGTNSGTWEYFTETICGKKGASRSDYSQSEDDNQLVLGVSGDKFALGYFGYSYFDENRDRLRIVKVSPDDDLTKAVEPSRGTIESGSYQPLSRPLFIYINRKILSRKEVASFLRFYLSDEGQKLVPKAHCIGLNATQLAAQRERLEAALSSASH